MKRYGVKPAPEGCGHVDTGPCEACVMRAVRHGRWMVRQLLPLKYSTWYLTGGPLISAEPGHVGEVVEQHPTFINVSRWRMFLGHVFAHDHRRFELAPGADIGA